MLWNDFFVTYIMVKKTQFMFPKEDYLNIIKRGYKDCMLDDKYLNNALKQHLLL